MSQEKSGQRITSISFVFLIVGIVVGAVIGYGASAGQVGPLQSQVANLQSQVTALQGQVSVLEDDNADLQDEVAGLTNQLAKFKPPTSGSWTLVKSFDGTGNLNSDYFAITGLELKIVWSYTSGEYAVFGFFLYKGDYSVHMNAFAPSSGTDYVHGVDVGGDYYLKINAANCQWSVQIYVSS